MLFNIFLTATTSTTSFDSYHGASSDLAAGFLHIRSFYPGHEVELMTENGSVIEREFGTYIVRVERAV